MSVQLVDLGEDFKVTPLNGSNQFTPNVKGTSFQVNPGVYILAEKTKNTRLKASHPWRDGTLGEYFSPASTLDGIIVLHDPLQSTLEWLPLQIEARVVSPSPVLKVDAYVHNGAQGKQMEMKKTYGFDYEVVIPANMVKLGFFSYYIVIQTADETITFPSGKIGQPYNWDFYDRSPYRIQVNKKEHPISIFNAKEDWNSLSFKSWPRGSQLVPTNEVNELEYQIRNCVLHAQDNENLNGPVIKDFTVRHYLNKKIDHLREQLINKNELVLKGRSLDEGPKNIQVAFILKDGSAFGKVIEFSTQLKEHRIPLKELKQVKMVTMPRPYPTFLPYYFEVEQAVFNVRNIEGIQINIGPEIDTSMLDQVHNIGISWISLE
jgi:hypothetical protein